MTWTPLALLTSLAALPAACVAQDHSPMRFSADGARIIATGEIDGGTMDRFRKTRAAHPGATLLVLQSVGGSVDDQANLEFSRSIRAMDLTTTVPSGGMVASGGTDLFLAGARRILEPGACVGVHSWAGDGLEGKDVPRDDPEHALYLDYYREMGIDPAFYWFTLQAAPAEGMHWMTAAEANRFGLSTTRVDRLGTPEDCDAR